MNRKFLVDENTLIRLVKAEEKLEALECGGVDNWYYYSDSLNDYLESLCCEDFNEVAKNVVDKDYEVFVEKDYRHMTIDEIVSEYKDVYDEVYNEE